jgi:hypothetical protein
MNNLRQCSRAFEPSRFLMPKAQTFLLAGLLTILAFLPVGCQKAPLKPVDITADDLCAFCRGMIAEKQYAAEFITKDGFVRKFDDIACMAQHAKGKVKKENVEAYFIMDFPSQQWVPAQEAKFVKSDKITTPKNSGILAFKDPAKAQALATQFQAQLLTLDDLLK